MRHRLNGRVMSNDDADLFRDFGYTDVCCPKDVRGAIEECPDDEELIFEINSGGGSVYAGFEMYSAIRFSGKNVTAEVQSIAGSAMSVVMAACTKVLMSPVANVMIHRAYTWSEGNSQVLKQDAQMLDTIDESTLTAYTEKAKGKTTKTQFAAMMRKETFMTAQQAIDCGLADGMMELQGNEPIDPMSAVAYAGCFDTLPSIEDLKKRKIKERENKMDIKTKEDLMKEYSELTAQIQKDAQDAERTRIAEIDGIAIAGFEDIIAAAKKDPTQRAGDVAIAIIAKQKEQGAAQLNGMRIDAQQSGANSIPAAVDPKDHEPENPEAEAKAVAALWKENRK